MYNPILTIFSLLCCIHPGCIKLGVGIRDVSGQLSILAEMLAHVIKELIERLDFLTTLLITSTEKHEG